MANGIGALCHCLVCRDLSSCWYCTYLQLCKQNRQGYRGKWAGRQLRFGIRGNGDRFVVPMVLLAGRILYSRYRMFVNWRYVLVCIERRYRYRTCENIRDDVTIPLRQLKVLFACVAVIVFFGGLVFQSTTTSLPKIMDAQFSQSLSLSSTLTTSIFVCAAFIQLVVGELIDRVDIKKLLACITGGQLLFLLLATVTHEWSLVLVFVGLMLCTYAQIPVNDWLIGRYSDAKWRSRIYAVKYTLSFSTGPIAYWLIAATYAHTQEFVLMYFILLAGWGLHH